MSDLLLHIRLNNLISNAISRPIIYTCRLKELKDGDKQGSVILDQMLDEWRRRLSVVQSDVRTIEPLLRMRRILLQQTQVIYCVLLFWSNFNLYLYVGRQNSNKSGRTSAELVKMSPGTTV